jgi:hypothetical protein
MNFKINNRIILAGIGIILLLLLIIPLRIPYRMVVQGKILPGRIWILQRETDGSMLITLRDHVHNIVSDYTAYQVERGDVLNFRLSANLSMDNLVSAGDTIGFIQSNIINGELAQLQGLLAVARSNLQVNRSGEKQSLVEAARNQYLLSQEQAQLQSKILERQKALFDSNLVSREEYEINQGTFNIFELQTAMAGSQLQALETGSKPEQIQLSYAEIHSLEREIRVLEQRLSQFVLISPLQGRVFTTFSAESLLFIADTTRIVYMPVNLREQPEVKLNQKIVLEANNGILIAGEIVSIDQMIQRLNDQQVFLVTAVLESGDLPLALNQIVPCTIHGQSKTPWNYLGRLIKAILN